MIDNGRGCSPPSPDHPRAGRLIVISGPSGVGKSTIVAGLMRAGPFTFSVSATTRPPRPGESDGTDYWFLSTDDFEDRIAAGAFLEWATYNGRYYGTPRAAVDDHLAAGRDVLLDIEIQGARQVRASHPEAVLVFIAPPSMAELASRLRGRGDTDEADVRRRLGIAAGEIAEAAALFDHIVVNDDAMTATAEVLDILGVSEGEVPA